MAEIDRAQLARDCRQVCVQMELQANRCMAQAGLTAIQAFVLHYILLHSENGTSLTEIRKDFCCSMATLSCMVKRLREKGYVRAESCAGDDRRKLLFATEKGRRIQADLEEALRAAQEQVFGCYSPEELATMDRLQRKMLRNLASLTDHTHKEVPQS